MPSKVYSAAVVGVEAFEVEIEVHAGWGNTDKIAVVGLPDTAVKESKDRVTSAISNSSLRWPYGKRITINVVSRAVSEDHEHWPFHFPATESGFHFSCGEKCFVYVVVHHVSVSFQVFLGECD